MDNSDEQVKHLFGEKQEVKKDEKLEEVMEEIPLDRVRRVDTPRYDSIRAAVKESNSRKRKELVDSQDAISNWCNCTIS